ncbi:MAG: DUF6457 domain-containing protein [Rhodoglobus sp.]
MIDSKNTAEVTQILRDWVPQFAAELSVPDIDIDSILGIAGTAAHTVIRPAAPLATYMLGYCAGRAAATGETPISFAEAAEIVRRYDAMTPQTGATE